MSDNSSVKRLIFELCTEIYKYEKFLVNSVKDQMLICYLIDSKSMDNLKEKIKYKQLKKYIENDISYNDFKAKIKDIKEKIQTNLNPEKFKNSKDLIKALNDKKKFYFITNFNLTKKICNNKDLSGSGIKFKLHKDKIILIFNETDELAFFNNYTGLIEKSLLVQDNQENNIKEKQFNSSTIKKQPCINYKFKADLEILIRLYYYNRYNKEKVNSKFNYLNKENSLSVYLFI